MDARKNSSKPTSPEEFVNDIEIARNWQDENAKFKFISRYNYLRIIADLKELLKDNELTPEEVDKIQLDVKDGEKFVRYCVTKERLSSTPEHIVAMAKKYKGYSNIYFSRTLNPFKTKGAYGFSHGGITPQELLVPYIKIKKMPEHENMLEISIANKNDLIAVIGDFYQIKIKAGQQAEDIFSNQRKIMIIFVRDKKQFNQSDIIQVKPDKEVEREFAFEQYDDFEIIVVDADTKIRLDSCEVKRYKARDLGGLGGKK